MRYATTPTPPCPTHRGAEQRRSADEDDDDDDDGDRPTAGVGYQPTSRRGQSPVVPKPRRAHVFKPTTPTTTTATTTVPPSKNHPHDASQPCHARTHRSTLTTAWPNSSTTHDP